MNLLSLQTPVKPSSPLAAYERNAILKRLSQIAVALGHSAWTAEQLVALVREQTELRRTLAADESQ
jgi:hypothetical protein